MNNFGLPIRDDRSPAPLVGHAFGDPNGSIVPVGRIWLLCSFPALKCWATIIQSLRDDFELPAVDSDPSNPLQMAQADSVDLCAVAPPFAGFLYLRLRRRPRIAIRLSPHREFHPPLSDTSCPTPPPQSPTSLRHQDAVSDAHATPLRKYRWLGLR
jgi:hypothetical protein